MSTAIGSQSRRGRLAGRSELGVALLLGVVGVVVLVDAAGIHAPYSQADPVGPRTVPFLVAGLLLVCAVGLAVNVLRGGHGEAEEGEDVDLTAPTEWRVVLPLVGTFVANVLLIDVLGWVISGALLFWGSSWALGSRHPVRDAVISLALSLATFYGFYLGLGVLLPAGVLEGVL
ncbi:MAG TPA: tripartite tricarboxylate transporter TctB family protein [Nocardioidaceae bacterium]|nr:tripartite tricarboxylate transporter TctB family protein [Nocardioidaceae bacterium]